MIATQRQRIGFIGVGIGAVIFFAGVLAVHFTSLSPTNHVGQEIYPFVPRCAWFESPPTCWVVPITSKLIAFVGSQIVVGAVVFGWIWKRRSTWALATVGAFIFTLEMIVLLGIVPNEWLGLTQGKLAWTDQKIVFTIPSWLVLNNQVSLSFGALKDIVVAGYSTTVLIAIAVGAYQLQERANRPEPAKPEIVSAYGRPVVKGER